MMAERTTQRVLGSAQRIIACTSLALLSACTSIDGSGPVLIPNETVALIPLGPNWWVEQRDLGTGRYSIALRKKRYSIGGDGESRQAFQRRIEDILREQGFTAYEVLEYSEGVDSTLPIAQRVAHGVVQFLRANPALRTPSP
jgi:hypothetical protein